MPEALDFAPLADPRQHRVAMHANLLVAAILQVESAVEVERVAILVEFRPDPAPARQDEIDLLGARQRGAADRCGGDALRTLLLDPVELRRDRPRLDRNAQDHFVLDDQARYRHRNRPGIGREQAEQQRNEADE